MRACLLGVGAALLGLMFAGPARADDYSRHRYHGHGQGHYHYVPGHLEPHRNHAHYVPGHFEYHRGPDYPRHGGYSSSYYGSQRPYGSSSGYYSSGYTGSGYYSGSGYAPRPSCNY